MDGGPSVGPNAMNAVLFYSPLLTSSEHNMMTAAFPSCSKRARTGTSSYLPSNSTNSNTNSNSSSSSSTNTAGSSTSAGFLSLPPPLPPSSLSVSFPVPPPAIEPLLSAELPSNNYWTGYPRTYGGTRCTSGSGTGSAGHPHSSTSRCSADTGPLAAGAASLFACDSFLPDDDATLYSLWSAPGGSDSVLGYETADSVHAAHVESPQVAQEQDQERGRAHGPTAPPEAEQSSLYLTSDGELKIDYPHLSALQEDLDSYLSETMAAGGPSPTTPLGTHPTHCSRKRDRLGTTNERLGGVPVPAAEQYVKRERATAGGDSASPRRTLKARGGRRTDAYAALPVEMDSAGEVAVRGTTTSVHRTLPQNAAVELKQRVTVGSHQGSRSPLVSAPAATGQTAGGASRGTVTLPSVATSTLSTSGAKAKKRPRSRQCEFPGCQNRARSHQKCKKHGGAHHCVFEGCTKNSQSRGLCIAHGGGSRCKKEGCIRAAQSKGLCKSHGGGEYCAVEECNKKAHLKHLCRTHGGGVRCKFEKCSKWAQRKGWCMAHAKEFASS
ncbi:unnamed protein product [Hyaloperonospora brassicae]|uniref:WRKY19-like zinc finger domain-containing protein n=1 Tax=Hyaloperonospora brassicae TaxID=162125 RepID=A0AAV0T2U3_HYABA|nr:unnamed protein product [Hyaloperonospora brassicae]